MIAKTQKTTAAKKTAKKVSKKTSVPTAVAKARATHHAVRASGKEFGSVRKAFEALKLPMGAHARFRKVLKREKKATFETDTGRKVPFAIAA